MEITCKNCGCVWEINSGILDINSFFIANLVECILCSRKELKSELEVGK